MEKTQIIVTSQSGSTKVKGELYSSGLIEYASGDYSHISAEISAGKRVSKHVAPEVVKEEVKPTSLAQTAPTKKKKVKG